MKNERSKMKNEIKIENKNSKHKAQLLYQVRLDPPQRAPTPDKINTPGSSQKGFP